MGGRCQSTFKMKSEEDGVFSCLCCAHLQLKARGPMCAITQETIIAGWVREPRRQTTLHIEKGDKMWKTEGCQEVCERVELYPPEHLP